MTTPIWMGNSLVVEVGHNSTTVYDVSDPKLPRRIGFLNMTRTRWYGYANDAFISTSNHFVLREGNLITVLERPR